MYAVFEAKIGGFLSGLKKMQTGLAKWRRRLSEVGNIITGVNAAFALMGRVGNFVGRQFEETFGFADQLAKTSDLLGIMPAQLASIQLAGELAGVSMEQMNKAIRGMLVNVGEFAATGQGEAKRAFAELGLDARIALKPADEMLAILVERINAFGDATKRQWLASEIFTRRGLAVLNLTAKTIRQARQDIADFFGIMTRGDFRLIERAKDAVTRFQWAIRGFKVQVAVFLAPILERAIEFMIRLRKAFGDPRILLDAIAVRIARIAGHMKDAFLSVKKIVGEIITQLGAALYELGIHKAGGKLIDIGMALEPAIGRSFADRFAAQLEAALGAPRITRMLTALGWPITPGTSMSGTVSRVLAQLQESKQVLGQVISPTRGFLTSGGPSRVQKVNDPQLKGIHRVLSAIELNTKGRGVAVTAP